MAEEKDNQELAETANSEVESLRAELEKVNAKNKELQIEKQKVKLLAQEAQDAADEAAAQAAERNGDIEALKASHAKQIAKLQADLDTRDGDLRTYRVDNEISRALTEHNVLPEHANVVTAFLKSGVKYDNGTATVDGVPLTDHINSFLTSGAGAHYRRAQNNSGGGATGNTQTTAPINWTKDDALGKRNVELQKLSKSNPSEYNSIVEHIGLPNLKV